MACETESADEIILSPTNVMANAVIEINLKIERLRYESLLFVANLMYTTSRPELIQKVINQNFYLMVNEAVTQYPDYPSFNLILIEVFDNIFKRLPQEIRNFSNQHGHSLFEQLQFSNSNTVLSRLEEFFDLHFETCDQEEAI
uniref:Uncharacterized protein n=1 Tax=Strombidium rassoulzadegani TaxID=1082188 RepID=A0A7S3FUZ8_9SPIT|mmetsp:Transcript_17505/g.29485  ORF Transcript_17505/g.29485 Transcript_17505/m.29485 type:complete len:143 (+) Transcript_17505:1616-2044(+)